MTSVGGSAVLKTNFAVEYKYGAFYTGGKIQISADGANIFCQCGCHVQVVQVANGKIESTIGQEDDEEMTCFCLSPDDQVLVVASQSLQLKQWDWKQNVVKRTWKAIHTGPISSMAFDKTSTLLATGGSDSTIKVWDIIRQYCTHNLRGHQGVVSVVEFHPDTERLQLFTAADDYKIRVWDLKLSSCLAVLESHFSVVTSLCISPDGTTLYSGSRDKVVSVWNLDKFEKKKTIPVYETLEGMVLLPHEQDFPDLNVTSSVPHFVTGGDKGILRIWNSVTGMCVYQQFHADLQSSDSTTHGDQESTQQIHSQALTALLYNAAKQQIVTVTYDHNIIFHQLADLLVEKQLVGYMEEVLDLKFLGENDSHLVVASNSELVKVFNLETWGCQVLHGHTDTVMALDVDKTGRVLATSSKDNSIRVWRMNPETHQVKCVCVGHGHTHTVPAVALSRLGASFVVSGSEDCTLKLWPLPGDMNGNSVSRLSCRATERAHDKDINAVVVAPNDKLIASGSHDKTAKLWNAADLSLLGVFRGHKRGVWCMQFSSVDQCLATGSGDGTIKLWNLSDFSCVKTFEGHDSLVLRLEFLSRGMQLVSSGSNGLIKLWTIKTSECVKTLDEHEDKIWALSVNCSQNRIATGAADSSLILWKDVTETELEEARKKQEDFILKEQTLSNLLQEKKYLKAIGLAITLEQPFRVLNIMKEILDVPSGKEDLKVTVEKLRDDQLDAVLRYSSQWNTNAKHCHVAQCLINILLKIKHPDELAELPNFKASLEGILPYTERHMARMNRLLQQATFVDYTWQSMRLVAGSRTEEIVKNEEGSSSVKSKKTYKIEKIGNQSNVEGLTTHHEAMEVESDEGSESSAEVPDSPNKQSHELKLGLGSSDSESNESSDKDSIEEITVNKTLGKRRRKTKQVQVKRIKTSSKMIPFKRKKVLHEKKKVFMGSKNKLKSTKKLRKKTRRKAASR